MASNAPLLPPLYTFTLFFDFTPGSSPSGSSHSNLSDSKSSSDKNASPRITLVSPVSLPRLRAPKSTNRMLIYRFPPVLAGFSSKSLCCLAFPLLYLDFLDLFSSSSCSRATGGRVYLTSPISATTAIVTQSPGTGTLYVCLSAFSLMQEYSLGGER